MPASEKQDQSLMTAESEEERDAEQYRKLLELYDESMRNLTEGEIVTGRVIGITSNAVIVDVGYKSEGLIPIEEFTDRGGELSVQVGEEVDVLLEKTEDLEGHVLLSYQKAQRMRRWTEVERAYKEGRIIKGRITDRIKGGLTVDVGLRAFLPGSLVDIKPVKNLESLRGQELEFKVISLDRRRNNIVLSRKAVLETELVKKKAETLKKLEEGARLRGTVKNITDYGVFIDLGGIDGLLHITDISWGRVNHPSEHFTVGDEVEVVVLKFDPETERVSLGYKQRSDDPWTTATLKYPVGVRVKGKVVSLTDYGAFVELEEGVEGLIHVSEMSWSKKVKHPSKVLTVGQEVECQVLGIDQEAHRISLGLKQVESNPWNELAEKYPVGSKIKGKVRNLTEFGAFVEVEEGIDGLIHISDLSWTKRVKHPSEVLKKGDTVEAVVLNIDAENQRLSLGLKQLATDMWDEFFSHHKVNDIVQGKVVRVTNFGAFVELHEGIEGLVHVSELDEKRIEKPEEAVKVGDVYAMKIIKINEGEKKIGLSIKAVKQDEYKQDLESYRESANAQETSTATALGDAFRAAQAARDREKE